MNNLNNLNNDEIRHTLQSIVTHLKAPVPKKRLIRLCKKMSGYKDKDNIETILNNTISDGQLHQEEGYVYDDNIQICHPIKLTARQVALQKYLPDLYKEACNDYNKYVKDIDTFFQWLQENHPGLAEYNANNLMDEIYYTVDEEHLSKRFEVEYNCSQYGWIERFFQNPDCRVWIADIGYHEEDHIFVTLFLIPGKHGSYKKAEKHYIEFCSHFKDYIDFNLSVETISMQYMV